MIGQINLGSPLGNQLYHLARVCPTWLDLGTWNGLGTTKILVDAVKPKSKIYSIEANCAMHKLAVENWTPKPECLELIYGRLSESMMTRKEVEAHPLFHKIKDHYILHYDQDFKDFLTAPICSNLPKHISAVVLDGGEFSGASDLDAALSFSPKVIVLDDTLVMKNHDNCKRLLALGWKKVCEGNDRNGWAIFTSPAGLEPIGTPA